jgi:beta-xylosidase
MNGKILKRDIVRNKDNEIVENKTRKVLAIIDWKTGKHGFYRSHEAQLHMYKLLVEENFPEIAEKHEIRLYNWAPKEWENEDDAKYTFKDQTESKEALKILNYIALFKVDHKDYEPKIKIINGKLRINQKNGNLRIMPYKEILAQRNNNSNSKEEQSLEPNAIPANDLPEDVLTAIGSIFENLKQKEGEQQ